MLVFTNGNDINNMREHVQTWNDILPSLSLSTMLNIILTNTASAFIPNADANSAFDNEVRMTTCTIEKSKNQL